MTNQQFTEKSREALAAAQQLTIEYQNQGGHPGASGLRASFGRAGG